MEATSARVPTRRKVAAHPERYCPACHRVVGREFRPGPGGRPDAGCPRCGALERHRFLAVLLGVLRPQLGDLDVLLEVSPSRRTTPMLAGLAPRRHLRMDLGADPREVDVLADLTRAPLRDDSIDLLVCYHVLEHIPDDRAAIGEIARVLAPGGLALLQVPFRPGLPTDEDPDADPQERLERFGQADHVRWYGDDFEERLMIGGLAFERVTPRVLLGPAMCTWLNLQPDEVVWLARRSTADIGGGIPAPTVPGPTGLSRTLDVLLREMVEGRAELEQARRRLARVERRLARLARAAPASTPPPSAPAAARRDEQVLERARRRGRRLAIQALSRATRLTNRHGAEGQE